mgnify:CR=1 FL=1|tara:strand:- start:20772 stop:24785 length:4014 start_codon:yes stop_codon:yes gene_type:complete
MEKKIINRKVSIFDEEDVNFDKLDLNADMDYTAHLNKLSYSNFLKMVEAFTDGIFSDTKPIYRLNESPTGLIDEVEIELRFFQDIFGGVSNTLSKFQFETIIDKLSSIDSGTHRGFNKRDDISSLDITFHKNNYTNNDTFTKLRYSIIDKQNIINFCKTNILPKSTDIMYKDPLQLNITGDNLTATKAYYKQYFKKNYKMDKIDLYEVRTRLGGKLELNYNHDMKKFNTNHITNSYLLSKIQEADSLIQDINNYQTRVGGSQNMYKTFRLKTRTSFILGDHIRIDLTKVKTSKKDIDSKLKYNLIPTKTFIEADINSQPEKYEMEIELINLDRIDKTKMKCAIFRSLYVFKYLSLFVNEQDKFTYSFIRDDVKHIYETLIDKIISERIDEKITADPGNRSLQKFKDQLTNNTGLFRDGKYRFISPNVVSIKMENLQENAQYHINDLNYCVTDKADGAGHILFKVGLDHMKTEYQDKYSYLKNRIFLIDNNLTIHDVDYKCVDGDDNMSILLNGEYLNYNKHQEPINTYLIYDAYYYGRDICQLNLMDDETDSITENRLSFAQKFCDTFIADESKEIGTGINEIISVEVKKFYKTTATDDIFSQTNKIWQIKDTFDYNLDGVIYTPTNCPVNFREKSNKKPYYIFQRTTWYKNIKWKPPHDNTIDVLIRFKKDIFLKKNNINITRNVTKIINEDEYIIGELYNSHNNKPVLFSPQFPNLGDVSFGLFKGERTTGLRSKIVIKDKLGKLVEDDTIIEVSYTNFDASDSSGDYIDNKNMRFTILRTRNDKTYTHRIAMAEQNKNIKYINKLLSILSEDIKYLSPIQKRFIQDNKHFLKDSMNNINTPQKWDLFNNKRGQSCNKFLKAYLPEIKLFYNVSSNVTNHTKFNYGNAKFVADKIWESIHNPVTEQTITTGGDIPTITSELDKYYNNELTQRRSRSKMIKLQKFHNKIKGKILIKNATELIIKDKLNTGYRTIDITDIGIETINLATLHTNIGEIISSYIYGKKIIMTIKLSKKPKKAKTAKAKTTKAKTDKSQFVTYKNSEDIDVTIKIEKIKKVSDTPVLSILDLCCGKGGDIFKWLDNDIKLCVGLDLFADCIYNTTNGAKSRYAKHRSTVKQSAQSHMEFFVADCSKKIFNPPYDKGTNAFYKSQDDFTKFNTIKPDQGFDIISIMFALHYFFKDETSLNNLIDNIDKNLRVGGILIGVCFDGEKIYNVLKDKVKDESIEGNTSANELIWKITKKYDNFATNNFTTDDNTTLGMPISVFVRSINTSITEYLVNFNYFNKKLEDKNIKIVPATEIGDYESIERLFPSGKGSLKDYEKQFSKLNKLFIFKKYS